MFDAGFSEFLLVVVIGLLILGPERLPRVAAQLGRWIGKARRTANQLRYQLEREIALDELQRHKRPKRPEPRRPEGPGRPDSAAPNDGAAGAPPATGGESVPGAASGERTGGAATAAPAPADSARPTPQEGAPAHGGAADAPADLQREIMPKTSQSGAGGASTGGEDAARARHTSTVE